MRLVAGKCTLACRADSYGDSKDGEIGERFKEDEALLLETEVPRWSRDHETNQRPGARRTSFLTEEQTS